MSPMPIDPKTVLRHCLGTRETPQGFLPLRFSPRQFDAYGIDAGRSLRARCAAGVTLDFESDSPRVEIAYEIGGMVRDWAYFDLLVDGVLAGRAGGRPMIPGPGRVVLEVPGPKKVKRLTIYLPQNVEIFIQEMNLQSGFFKPAPVPAKKLLAMGDSITQGMEAKHPASTYTALMAQSLGCDLLNQGVGGHIFDGATVDASLPYRPDLITAAYGTNDWNKYQHPEDFKKACGDFLSALVGAYPKTPICLITPTWRHDLGQTKGTGTFEEHQNLIKDCAKIHPTLTLLDGRGLVPNHPDYFADGLHPTDEGFYAYALALRPYLEALLP